MIIGFAKWANNPEGVSWFSETIMPSLRDLNEYLHSSIIVSSLRDYKLDIIGNNTQTPSRRFISSKLNV